MDDAYLIVRAKVKDACHDFNVSGDFADELNKKALELVKNACKRAEANGRRTVMSKDL